MRLAKPRLPRATSFRSRSEGAAVAEHLRLAVALDGYGWHPEASRHTRRTLEPVTESTGTGPGSPPPPNAACSIS